MTEPSSTRAVVQEHINAFNAHDTDRLLRGLDENVVWSTGSDVFRGRTVLATIFDDWLWERQPRLELKSLAEQGEFAAAECVEHMLLDGTGVEFPIAVFFSVRDGLLRSVRVYREGTAELSDASVPSVESRRVGNLVLREQTGAGSICRSILGELPEWFGIEEAVDDYVELVSSTPTIVAAIEGEDVGFLTTVDHSPYSAEIYVMGVRPRHHRRGIGHSLVCRAEQLAVTRGIEYMQVKTLSERRPHPGYAATHAFYFACGFRPLEEFPTLWNSENPALQLVKRLS